MEEVFQAWSPRVLRLNIWPKTRDHGETCASSSETLSHHVGKRVQKPSEQADGPPGV